MRKKTMSLVLMAAMITGLLVGCGNTAGETKVSEASETDNVVTLTYWGWDSNYYEPMFEAYEETHPDVHFEPTAVEWGDMLTKTQQALASGSELPTIIPMDKTLIENWKKMDILEDLTEYGFNPDDYVQPLIEKAITDDGKVIGCIESVAPAAIAYKRDLAKEYLGTDDPEKLASMLSSYEAYVEKGKEIADKSGGNVFMFHSGQAVAEWFFFASSIPTQTNNTINYTEKMTDVLSKLIALRDVNAVDTYQNGTPEANATYAGDTHIFYPCPDWAIPYYIQGNDPEGSGNWGMIKAPVSYNHGGTYLGITSQATDEQKQAAYDFIYWATSTKEGLTVAKETAGCLPACTEYATDAELTERVDGDYWGGQDISKLLYSDVVSEMVIAPSSEWDNALISVRNDVAQLVLDNKDMTLEEALKIGKEQLTQLVTDSNIEIK